MSVRKAPLVFPAMGRHSATVIFAHGLGDSGHGWAPMVENWRRRQRLDEVKFILPHAPSIPITCNMGMRMPGWYDIATLDGSVEGLRRSEDEAGTLASRDYLRQLIQAEIDGGLASDRIVVGGFSQGGAMALFSGLTAPVRLAGIVAMSAYLPLSLKLESTYLPAVRAANSSSSSTADAAIPNQDVPILMCHGTADRVVPMQLGKLSAEHLTSLGFQVEWKTYANMPHSADPEEIDDVEAFLGKVLPPRGNASI